MNFFVTFLIFIILLFLYVHINDQYKKSEDLEIYEMDYISNTNLQEVCNVKQPTLFEFKTIYPDIFEKIKQGEHIHKTEDIDVKVRDVLDYSDPNVSSVDPIVLPFRSFQTLAASDPAGHYFMEDNQEFLQETDFLNDIRDLDPFLKPAFTVNFKYDCMMGSANAGIPLRYHTDYRKFLLVGAGGSSTNSGKISVKMTPWRSRKYLHPVKDYENYEFWSRVNPWNQYPYYKDEMNKLKFLEFDVREGYILYIPPYWWYSIKFSNCETPVFTATYQTAMNVLSNTPDLARYYLQFHNTKHKMTRTLDISPEDSGLSPNVDPILVETPQKHQT